MDNPPDITPNIEPDGNPWVNVVFPVFAYEDSGTGTRHLAFTADPGDPGKVTIEVGNGTDSPMLATIRLRDLERALRVARAILGATA